MLNFERKLGRKEFANNYVNKNLSNFKIVGNMLEFTLKSQTVRRLIKKDKNGKYINLFEYKVYINEVIKCQS